MRRGMSSNERETIFPSLGYHISTISPFLSHKPFVGYFLTSEIDRAYISALDDTYKDAGISF